MNGGHALASSREKAANSWGVRARTTWEKSFHVRVVAIIAAYNEERFIAGCLEHLFRHGVEAYLIDNCSIDQTVAIARRYLGHGLIGLESFPRLEGRYNWRAILLRKEELAVTLDADWFMHVDADEIRLSPRTGQTLAAAFAELDEQGYNAVEFFEFTFIPTREEPDHDHPNFQSTMRRYYPFRPWSPHRLNAWRRQPARVELAWFGGHRVRFPGLRVAPVLFPMRHYLFLSVAHFLNKYTHRVYDPAEVQRGWHGWRSRLKPDLIKLPTQAELRLYTSDDELDPARPRTRDFAEEWAKKSRRRRWFYPRLFL
jgi:glycosyltransferase involved in cell wall biosynthesis